MADAVLADHWRTVLTETDRRSHGEGDGPAGARPGGPARPFLVGIAWQGSRANPIDRWRSFPLASLAPLANVPGVRLISLQVGDGVDQLAAARGRSRHRTARQTRPRLHGNSGHHDSSRPDHLTRLGDHPPGRCPRLTRLGRALHDRRMALARRPRQSALWYPTVRRFRQTTLGHWDEVFEQMAGELGASSTRSRLPHREPGDALAVDQRCSSKCSDRKRRSPGRSVFLRRRRNRCGRPHR